VIDVQRVFMSLSDGGLIYPDGSFHTHLGRALDTHFKTTPEKESKL